MSIHNRHLDDAASVLTMSKAPKAKQTQSQYKRPAQATTPFSIISNARNSSNNSSNNSNNSNESCAHQHQHQQFISPHRNASHPIMAPNAEVIQTNSAQPNQDDQCFVDRSERTSQPAETAPLMLENNFLDHCSMPSASCVIRSACKTKFIRVFNNRTMHWVLEESYDRNTKTHNFTMRNVKTMTKRLQGLRALYTAVAALLTGFLFGMCMHILLNVVLDLTLQSGQTTKQKTFEFEVFAGIMLAIVSLVNGFSSMMILATTFCSELWSGHHVMSQCFHFWNTDLDKVVVEWFFSTTMMGLPTTMLCITLSFKMEEFWTWTSLTWIALVALVFVLFASSVGVVRVARAIKSIDDWNEMKQRNNGSTSSTGTKSAGNDDSEAKAGDRRFHWFRNAIACIELRQVETFSAIQSSTLMVRTNCGTGAQLDVDKTDIIDSNVDGFLGRLGPWTAVLTNCSFLHKPPFRFFDKLETPECTMTTDDVRKHRPFVTKSVWGLGRVFCLSLDPSFVAVIHGSGALTDSQIQNSITFCFVGNVVYPSLVAAVSVWFDLPTEAIVCAVVISSIFTYLVSFKDPYRIIKTIEKEKALMTEQSDQDGSDYEDYPSTGICVVRKHEKTIQPTKTTCMVLFALEMIVFVAYPYWTLLHLGNRAISIIFLIVVCISYTRYYFDVALVMDKINAIGTSTDQLESSAWTKKSCLTNTVSKITNDSSRMLWTWIFRITVLIYIAISQMALGTDPESTKKVRHTYLDDFYYPPASSDRLYASCKRPDIDEIFGKNSTIADYIFLAGLAYNMPNETQEELNGWFQGGVNVDFREEDVRKYKERKNKADSAASFKLFTVKKKHAIVSIRGTQNAFDVLADSQLWFPALIVQGIRALLPFGAMWTPILEKLVYVMDQVESREMKNGSFEEIIAPFIEQLKKDPKYDHVQVTGHSLGGGLSTIVGAQMNVSAIAVSGPNAMISRKTFRTPITGESLNRHTFNIIPDRDPVPRIDDVAEKFQSIRCNANPNDFIGCHDFTRALCEIATNCGSANRPVLCACHQKYGFAKPLPRRRNQRSFEEACAAEVHSAAAIDESSSSTSRGFFASSMNDAEGIEAGTDTSTNVEADAGTGADGTTGGACEAENVCTWGETMFDRVRRFHSDGVHSQVSRLLSIIGFWSAFIPNGAATH